MDLHIESLVKWLETFDIVIKDLNCLTDGFKIAKVLNKIVPDYFNDEWFNKVKEIENDQWRLKVSNLKKIIEKIMDFFENVLYLNLDEKCYPDANLIAKNTDLNELSKLIQLVLGVAVNCETKQLFIQDITKLDISIQQNLMQAIQLLLTNERSKIENTNSTLNSILPEDNLKEFNDELIKSQETLKNLSLKNEELSEKIYELENNYEKKEKENFDLQKQIENLNSKLKKLNQDNSNNINDEFNEKNIVVQKLKTKIDNLEKELLKSESQKEDLQLKINLLNKDILELNSNNEELKTKVKEAKLLKDELDVHRHNVDKVVKYEEKLESYKKKLEELSDIKKQVKLLEDKNKLLVENSVELEEELKKMNLLKNQVNEYKKRVQELIQQVVEKTHDIDKKDFEFTKLNKKYETVLQERNLFEEENFELKTRLNTNNLESNFSFLEETENSNNKIHNLNYEIKSEDLENKEKAFRLEIENKLLKQKLNEINQEDLLLTKANYEDAKQRIEELENDNRNLNKKLIEKDSKLNDLLSSNKDKLIEDKKNLVHKNLDEKKIVNNKNDFENLLKELNFLKQKLKEQDEKLIKKDEEIIEVEEKYRKYVHKAKQIITVLEPLSKNLSSNSSLQNSFSHFSINDSLINLVKTEDLNCLSNLNNEKLKQLLILSNQKLALLQKEFEKYKISNDLETRLMTTSIHNLAFDMMRKAASERTFGFKNSNQSLTNNNSNNSSLNVTVNSQSFLTKQRQATSRKINLEKVSNSAWN